MSTVLSVITLVFVAVLVSAVLLAIGHWLLRRGVTRHEFRVGSVVLLTVGAVAFAHILGVRIDGTVNLAIRSDSWVPIAGPIAIAAVCLALLWGKA